MTTRPIQKKDQDIVMLLVYEKPVGFYVTLAVAHVVSVKE